MQIRIYHSTTQNFAVIYHFLVKNRVLIVTCMVLVMCPPIVSLIHLLLFSPLLPQLHWPPWNCGVLPGQASAATSTEITLPSHICPVLPSPSLRRCSNVVFSAGPCLTKIPTLPWNFLCPFTALFFKTSYILYI